ncbi:MAG: DUF111 family protein [Firmicutes bacterium]|nr:DUF111 family protein [Bacillota bacterium]
MKTLYIDCRNGICSDMVLSALRGLGIDIDPEEITAKVCEAYNSGHSHSHSHDHDHDHEHGHYGYMDISRIIATSDLTDGAPEIAQDINRTISKAEAKVHGATLSSVHFHEVGRPEAVGNILSIAACISTLSPDRIICSEVHDGQGEIECSHGIIPVPVPAVRAIMESKESATQGHTYITEDVGTELVTPSGLGILVGLGAVEAEYPKEASVIARATGYGSRDTGRGGLEMTLLEE